MLPPVWSLRSEAAPEPVGVLPLHPVAVLLARNRMREVSRRSEAGQENAVNDRRLTTLPYTAEEYHTDQVGLHPTLSRSIAHILCTASPKHAWTAHPRLNPDYKEETSDAFDLGSVVHDLYVGGPDRLVVVDANDWRTNAAKEQRELARSEGKIALLEKNVRRVDKMLAALQVQVRDHSADPPLFIDGKPEVTLTWEDEGVQCRARLDWLRDDRTAIDDLKTTSRSANPEEWSMFSVGGDLQAYMYSRAVEVLFGVQPVFRFIVAETTPPYAVSVVTPGPDVLTLARKKFVYAAAVWRRCLDSGEWPAYPARVATVDLPVWLENRWLLKEERELVA